MQIFNIPLSRLRVKNKVIEIEKNYFGCGIGSIPSRKRYLDMPLKKFNLSGLTDDLDTLAFICFQ